MTETVKADGRRQTREEWGRRLEEAKTTQAAKTAAEWLHDRKEAAARRSFVPSIQARFIAAYTDRRPEDIKGEELAKCQTFWNKHPEATADLMAGGIDDDTLRQMLAQWMNTDIVKDFIFHGADLKAAYLQYDAQGRRLVDSALGKDGVVFSERYIRAAILPDVENGFVGRLDEGVKGEIRRAFNLKTRPAVAVSAFLLFCAVYDMSNEERRGRLADALGVVQGDIEDYLDKSPVSFPIVFKESQERTEENSTTGNRPEEIRQLVADADIMRQMARNNSNDIYSLSIDTSVVTLIGQPFGKPRTVDDGRVDFTIYSGGADPSRLIDAQDVLLAVVWESIRRSGGRYITPLDIWHKIYWGVTDSNSKDRETERRLLDDYHAGHGALMEIERRITELMAVKVKYSRYKTSKKQSSERKTSDLMFEYENSFIPSAPRYRIKGHGDLTIWETALIDPDEKYDGYSPLPYKAAADRNKIIPFPASQIDLKGMGIYCTLHIATLRDIILRMVANAQTHGQKFVVESIEYIYKYGRIGQNDESLEENSKQAKDRRRKRKQQDGRTIAKIGEGLRRAGVLSAFKTTEDGRLEGTTARSYPSKPKRGRKKGG